jgi:hypothetical protein
VTLFVTEITEGLLARVRGVRFSGVDCGVSFVGRAIETCSSNERAIGDVLPGGGVGDRPYVEDRGGSKVIALVRSREFAFLVAEVPAESSEPDSTDDDGKFSLDEDDAGGHLSRTDFFLIGGDTIDRSS